MAYIDRLSSPFSLEKRDKTEDSAKDHSLYYLACIAAFGLFFSIICTALTPPEWLPEPVTSDQVSNGLNAGNWISLRACLIPITPLMTESQSGSHQGGSRYVSCLQFAAA
jgi:hypothetical protein